MQEGTLKGLQEIRDSECTKSFDTYRQLLDAITECTNGYSSERFHKAADLARAYAEQRANSARADGAIICGIYDPDSILQTVSRINRPAFVENQLDLNLS